MAATDDQQVQKPFHQLDTRRELCNPSKQANMIREIERASIKCLLRTRERELRRAQSCQIVLFGTICKNSVNHKDFRLV